VSNRKRVPVVLPVRPPLTFRGLDLCDGCGAPLEPGDRLSGLCPACRNANAVGPIPERRRRPDR
jgi:predicted amidophosphoribosyltransferase